MSGTGARLLVDIGNTRIKWAIEEVGGFTASGRLWSGATLWHSLVAMAWRGFALFGVLAAVGIVSAFVLMLTVVPSIRVLLDRRAERCILHNLTQAQAHRQIPHAVIIKDGERNTDLAGGQSSNLLPYGNSRR